ncbi:MAG: methyl-accepting chemotaxis protein, partial [Actinomycetes bacterium]
MTATVSVHVLFTLVLVGAFALELRFTPDSVTSQMLGVVAAGIAATTALVVSTLAVTSWRQARGIDTTSVWDPVSSLAQLAAALLAMFALGGFSGIGWVLVLLLVPYFGVVFSTGQLRALAVAVSVLVAGAGAAAGSVTSDELPTAVIAVCAVFLSLWFTEQSASYLFDMRRLAQGQQRVVEARAQELTVALGAAAHGDLTVHAPEPGDAGTGTGTNESTRSLDELAAAFDHTVANLRVLVGAVRSGGEQLGAAAGQVLVSAQEQAASAAQQSSAVSQTTATIEELAATAAQIAETSELVASFATQTLGFAEEGR